MRSDRSPAKVARWVRALDLTWPEAPRRRRRPASAAGRACCTPLRAGLVALLLLGPAIASAQSERVPLVLREGLLYVPVRLMGCVQKPDLELLLDTGSAVTVLPQAHMQRMGERHTALPLGDANIEMVDGGAAEARHFLVEGLRIGSCALPRVRALSCPSEGSHWKLVLGMDVLARLADVRIEIGPRGGELVFSCPPDPSDPDDECGEP